MRTQNVDQLHVAKLFPVGVKLWHFQCVRVDNTRKIALFVHLHTSIPFLYTRQNFPVKDVSLYDSIVRMISLTLFGRMADGIFANGENAVDELLVCFIVWIIEIHGINHFQYFMPPITPRLYRRTITRIGTSNECIKQKVCADNPFLDGPDTHTHVVALCTTGFI